MIGVIFFRYVLMLVLCTTGHLLLGQYTLVQNKSDYTVTKRLLSVEDGLASHEIFCGIQDRAGFLWFGTRNGLNRYDGKNCLLFNRQRKNLQDNKVVQLAKDDADQLFIEYGNIGFKLTTNAKIDVMNVTTLEVKSLTAAFPNMPFKEQDVYWISNDGTNEINFLTAYPFRLWKYSSKKGFKLRYEIDDWNEKDSLPLIDHRSSGAACMFGNGKALLKLSNQLTQYIVTKDTVIAFTQVDVLRSQPMGFTSKDDLLLTYNTKTEPDSFTVGMITAKGSVESNIDARKYNVNNIKGRYWYQFASSIDGTSCAFYINTDALYLWNENTFLKVVSKGELKAFENLFLYQLFPDNLGNLWLCTSIGVLQLTIEKNRFQPYFTSSQQNIQSNSQARGIYADDTGKVVANIWTHTFMQQGLAMQNTSDEEIKYAMIRHHSSLYCGGYNLFHYDEVANKISKCAGGGGSEIWSMFSLNDSLLMLGRTNGFLLFNSNTHHFDSLTVADKNMPDAKFVYRFFRGYNDTLWAVAENGLYTILPNTRSSAAGEGQWSIVNIQSSVASHLSLLDAYQDADGIIWLATNGEGLYRWDRKNGSFRQFNITSGFPSDVLYRIEADKYNNLWISSDYGLTRFNLKSFLVNTYTTVDGISNNEFNRTSSFKANDGRLFFGGLDGVNAFYPRDFKSDSNTFTVPLRVISLNQFVNSKNGLVNKTTELLNAWQITLEPNDKFFILEFQLLDFAKDEVHRYGYKIDGVDKDWIYINENSIRISGLPYGQLTLRIKAQNREGAWSQSELSIPLHVLKPFYFQWWFILLTVMLVIAAIYLLVHLRLKQLAADKRKLEQTIHERTAQLRQSVSIQSALLTEKDVLLKEIHHRVKNNLQVISGLLELQSKGLNDDIAKEALREGRNRVKSIALIHQNLYRVDGLSSIELKQFVSDLCRQIETVFQKQDPVIMNILVPDLHLDIDSAVPLGLIMNELLSNSFKYAFDGISSGEIRIEIRSLKEGSYQLQYSDNGIGLPADFNVATATTLGIQLIYDLSRQIGGTVVFENNNGASFTINFTNRNMRKNED